MHRNAAMITNLSAIILAAGSSKRFGKQKLCEKLPSGNTVLGESCFGQLGVGNLHISDNENLLVVDSVAKYYSININSGKINWSKNSSYPYNSEIKKFKNTFLKDLLCAECITTMD